MNAQNCNVRPARLKIMGRAIALSAATAVTITVILPTPTRAGEDDGWVAEALRKSQPPQAKPTRAKSLTQVSRSNLGAPKSAEPRQSNPTSRPSLSGGSISWQASSDCVPSQLRGVLSQVAATIGPVTVTSTCRSASQNRAAGGAGQSYHLSGEAVDFRTHGSTNAVYAYLSSSGNVGGLKHYGDGLFHIDTGPRRSW